MGEIHRKCVVCGITKTQFVRRSEKEREGHFVPSEFPQTSSLKLLKVGPTPSGGSILNEAINNLPFEMHLPGHNFTGPGTKLKKRLTSNLTPKTWSKPVNRVDNAAYHHDVCYLKNKDTKTRNQLCDKNMLDELKGIVNPTLRERMDRSIVDKLIWSKMKFGMGQKKKLPGVMH